MSDFKPPKPNRAIIWLSELLLPIYLNLVERVSFEFFETPDRPVEFLKGKSAVVVLNHSDRQDPLLVMALSKYIRESFYCVAAREVFDWSFGLLGWLFQRLGCFSVDRGTTDFRSIHTIQKILTDSDRKFVVFPEGEITGDDQFVHDISPTLIHIFLKAQNELSSDGSNKTIWILPVGVTYGLETDLHSSINRTLSTIERHLGIKNDCGSDIAQRVKFAVGTVLRNLSEHYKFVLPDKQPQHEQVRLLARHICQRISTYRGHVPTQDLSNEQLLHSVRSEISDEIKSAKDSARHRKGLQQSTLKICGEFLGDLDRVERLVIVQRILKQKTSPIQICRVTDFLEAETCGRMTAKGRQRASVFFGEPIDVIPYLQAYQSEKDAAIDQLRDTVRDKLQLALDNAHTTVSGTLCNSRR